MAKLNFITLEDGTKCEMKGSYAELEGLLLECVVCFFAGITKELDENAEFTLEEIKSWLETTLNIIQKDKDFFIKKINANLQSQTKVN